MRSPTPAEMQCLQLVAARGGSINHDDQSLAPFLDDKSTLSKPDVFNSCHDLGWLHTSHDNRTENSYAKMTPAGYAELHGAFSKQVKS